MFRPTTVSFLVIALLLILGGGWFFLHKNTDLQEPTLVENLPSENISRIPDNSGTEGSGHPRIVPIEGTTEAWYEMPEIGVRFLVAKDVASDLVYDVKDVNAVSDTHGAYTFLNVALRSKNLMGKEDADCSEELGAIMKFQRTPDFYDGSMWREVNEEVSLGNMHLYNGYFIVAHFSTETVNPYSRCSLTKYSSEFDNLSSVLMNSFRQTVEEIPESK